MCSLLLYEYVFSLSFTYCECDCSVYCTACQWRSLTCRLLLSSNKYIVDWGKEDAIAVSFKP